MRAYTYGVGLRLLLVEILRRKLAVCRRYVAQQKNTQLEYEKNCILAVSSIYGIDPDKSGLHLHQKQARTPAYPDIAKEFKILTKYNNRLLVEESFDAFFWGFFEGLVLDFDVCHLGIARDEFV